MNHYEELGVSPSASTAEIRQAYKSLVRVLHPDQQQDENLRRLSELQLRRLNDLFQILSDPDQRRAYDLSLHHYLPLIRHLPVPETDARKELAWSDIGSVRLRLRVPAGVMVWLLIGTIALGSAIVWLRSPEPAEPSALTYERSRAADSTQLKLGPTKSPPTVPDRPSPFSVAANERPKRDEVPAMARNGDAQRTDTKEHAPGTAGKAAPIGASQGTPVSELSDKAAATAPRPVPAAPLSPAETRPQPAVVPTATTAAPGNPEPSGQPPVSKPQSTSMSGKWLYVPSSEDGKKTLYAPEYIELRINNRAGLVRGRYYGKYRVSDRAISSEVNFQFEGRQGDTVSILPWASNNGAKGELRLKRLSAESLEVHWITTTFGQANTLASGSAVLYRSDP